MVPIKFYKTVVFRLLMHPNWALHTYLLYHTFSVNFMLHIAHTKNKT